MEKTVMAVTTDRPAPYAPTSAIMAVVERNRNGKLPGVIDADVLERAGISASLIPRTLQALQALDLIEENGQKTDTLEGLRLASEGDYKSRLAEWLTEAYADALVYIDPATATETDVRDAFRKYIPTGQQDRMVSLFMGLFTAAGVMPERQRQVAPRKQPNSGGMRMAKVVNPPLRQRTQPKQSLIGGAGGGGGGFTPPAGIPPAVAGLVQSLPPVGEGWTKAERDKFVTTFGAVLDFVYPIVEASAKQSPDPDDDENGD